LYAIEKAVRILSINKLKSLMMNHMVWYMSV